ncbi:MAG: hypothetical protein R3B65_01110 [Candidatus Paceibacterota bacterium]
MEKGPEKNLGRTYAGINLEGRKAMKDGSVPEFKGFPPEFEKRMNVWAEFSNETKEEIKERIIKPLEEIESSTNIDFYLADRDFKIHSSIMQGKLDGDLNVNEKYQNLLENSDKLKKVSEELSGISIELKYLLFDKKGTIILASTKIPDQIPESRDLIKEAYAEESIYALDIPIFHLTIGRVLKLPEIEQVPESMKKLKTLIRNLRLQISSDPINAKIDGVNLAQGGVAKGGKTNPIKNNE